MVEHPNQRLDVRGSPVDEGEHISKTEACDELPEDRTQARTRTRSGEVRHPHGRTMKYAYATENDRLGLTPEQANVVTGQAWNHSGKVAARGMRHLAGNEYRWPTKYLNVQ